LAGNTYPTGGKCEGAHTERADLGVFTDKERRPSKTAHGDRDAQGGSDLFKRAGARKWDTHLEPQDQMGGVPEAAPDLLQAPTREGTGDWHS
jgi:hypothetical protein